MRVLAVAQRLGLLQRQVERGGQPGGVVAGCEPVGDGGVVGGGVGEGGGGQAPAQPVGQGAVAAQLLQHLVVASRDRRPTPTCAQFLAAARTMVGPPTSISSIDGLERKGYRLQTTSPIGSMPWAVQVGEVGRVGEVGQDAAMEPGMEGLDPPAEHLGRPGHRLHGERAGCRPPARAAAVPPLAISS